MRKATLGIDIGTSKICALAWTDHPVSTVSLQNNSEIPGLKEGRHEQSPLMILEVVKNALFELTKSPECSDLIFEAVGVSGQMHGVLLADSNLRPVTNLVTWRDKRCLEVDFSEYPGEGLNPGYGGSTLYWLKKKNRLPDGATALSIADFVVASMTGRRVMDRTMAHSFGLLNVSGFWDEALLDRLDLPISIFPGITETAIIGTVTPDAKTYFGLEVGTPVCAAIGDNQASVIGATMFDESAAVVNIGTGAQISIPTTIRSADTETRPMPFGGFLTVGASLSGGWNYGYLMEFFRQSALYLTGHAAEQQELFSLMNKLAESAPPGTDGLRVDTRFAGTRKDPAIKGSIDGINVSNLTPANLCGAFLEGMVSELFELVPPGALDSINRIVTSGNAIRKNPLLNRMISGRFNLPVEISAFNEEAAVGAALCARKALDLGK